MSQAVAKSRAKKAVAKAKTAAAQPSRQPRTIWAEATRRADVRTTRRGPSLPHLFGEMHMDYLASKGSEFQRKRTGFNPMGSSADYHFRSEADFLKTMELARDMDRNDMVVPALIDRAIENTLGDGPGLDPGTGDEEVDDALWNRWDEWSSDADLCDASGENDFAALTELATRQSFVDGDHMAVGLKGDVDEPLGGPLQAFEAHRIRTPKGTTRDVVLGVRLDDLRRRLEYWVTREDIGIHGSVQRVADVQRFDVRDKDGVRQVFHLYYPRRSTQTRGASALTPCFVPLGFVEDINYATLVKQQMGSCVTLFRQRDKDFNGGNASPLGADKVITLPDGTERVITGIAPGLEITGYPGETLHGFSPNIPNPEFIKHMRFVLQMVGINLGVPLILLLLDGSETTFSGWRGAMDQAKKKFAWNQRALVRRWLKPIYLWKVSQWMALDAELKRIVMAAQARAETENKRINVFAHRWNMPGWPYVEPLKDTQADVMQVKNNLTSRRRQAAKRDGVWDDISRENIEDTAAHILRGHIAAENLKKQGVEGVTWRDTAQMPAEGAAPTESDAPLERRKRDTSPQAPADDNEGED